MPGELKHLSNRLKKILIFFSLSHHLDHSLQKSLEEDKYSIIDLANII